MSSGLSLAYFFSISISAVTHFPKLLLVYFSSWPNKIPLCVCGVTFSPFIYLWTSRLCYFSGYCEQVKQQTQTFKYPCFLRVCVPQWFRWGDDGGSWLSTWPDPELMKRSCCHFCEFSWSGEWKWEDSCNVGNTFWWSPGKRLCKKETFACLPWLLCASPSTLLALLLLLRLHSSAGIITQLLQAAYIDFQCLSRNTPGLQRQTARPELLRQYLLKQLLDSPPF